MAATFADVAMGFRALAASPVSQTLVEARDNGSAGAWLTPAPTIVQIRMNDGSTALPDGTTPPVGSVTIRFRAMLPNIDANGWNTIADFRIRINRAVFDDHALLKKTDATLGWFVRNEWYRNIYYAVAQANTADAAALARLQRDQLELHTLHRQRHVQHPRAAGARGPQACRRSAPTAPNATTVWTTSSPRTATAAHSTSSTSRG